MSVFGEIGCGRWAALMASWLLFLLDRSLLTESLIRERAEN
jgi:hypothetical protein